MTHIVHPYAHRLGIIKDWKSRWFGVPGNYNGALRGDVLLREYLTKRLRGMYIGGIEIERNQKTFRLIIRTSRPGMLIGRSGEGSAKLRADIMKMAQRAKIEFPKDFHLDIEEIKSPESNAAIVAQMIAEGLEKRLPFRMVLKQTMEKVMANKDVRGAKLALSGRLGGADMSRSEALKRGGIPLQTFRSDIDFVREKAYMPYGVIGIKVWIYKGDVFEKKGENTQTEAR
ncbi:MAG: 30S ribosomal protein S3 [Candidatus Yonathbacteria bacterium RIFCSPHIGHO2_01_FULL_51_10]|uniref:Small ribosomal subunit protein uS3 n=1 Tax=Candidatus Yonathbacteria bacterium RIFCSPHIGHO2_01_FULL_51_10 TaxID=1802723 RepID=A0A1G2S9Z1_9BACT|nr:MAG: 30S ribosomal protein S3 [Candidatus Yonathbacteria bacterium RIFCSPHIGHO2_01_FULL_51_10]